MRGSEGETKNAEVKYTEDKRVRRARGVERN